MSPIPPETPGGAVAPILARNRQIRGIAGYTLDSDFGAGPITGDTAEHSILAAPLTIPAGLSRVGDHYVAELAMLHTAPTSGISTIKVKLGANTVATFPSSSVTGGIGSSKLMKIDMWVETIGDRPSFTIAARLDGSLGLDPTPVAGLSGVSLAYGVGIASIIFTTSLTTAADLPIDVTAQLAVGTHTFECYAASLTRFPLA